MKRNDEIVISKTVQDLANKSRKLLKEGGMNEKTAEIMFSIIGLRAYFLQMERRDAK